MIRIFKIGSNYKSAVDGSYATSTDTWKNSSTLSVQGISRYDFADENDTNRPIYDLADNDRVIETVLKKLLNKRLKKGIIEGCLVEVDKDNTSTLPNELGVAYEWDNTNPAFHSFLGSSNNMLQNRYNSTVPTKALPFIPAANSSTPATIGSLLITDTVYSKFAYVLSDGIIVGENGNFFVNYPNLNDLRIVLIQSLKLDLYQKDLCDVSFNETTREITIYVKRFMNGSSGDVVSDKNFTCVTRNLDYKLTVGDANSLYELLQPFITATVTTAEIENILCFPLYTRFVFAKSYWNYIYLNETTKRMECYFYPFATGTSNDWERLKAIDDLNLISGTKTLLYSCYVDTTTRDIKQIYRGGYQDVSFSSISGITITGTANGTGFTSITTAIGLTNLITELNATSGAGTFGAVAYASEYNGYLRVTSKNIAGGNSKIRITSATNGIAKVAKDYVSGYWETFIVENEESKTSSPIHYLVTDFNERITLTELNVGDTCTESYTNQIFSWNGFSWIQIA